MVSKTKAAIDAAREENDKEMPHNGTAVVDFANRHVKVNFRDGVGLAAEELIKEHDFNISPSSAEEPGVTLYK